ncbi:carboxypeptidase regulatory-like domain-containing protein [Tahibacter amnicola]|uniref:Carboxypeptidase regulatory-like domain-containing protein n=1 Tax=Tahibacter amnicola TaxID=2976241 RepID=A0ABY6BDT8_9GAMM|nr:carboxypeptidase regulatory-like domain-containing protein [Tahibacter amnicola]UXI68193.1 carboxypeptidase regulatory-like domain-containing protein [Tahibacter amnicola]
MTNTLGRRMLRAFAGIVLAISAVSATAQSVGVPPAGASCVVTAGNRNAPLAPDGTYTVFGIPGNLGAIRARVTCSDGSVGQSEAGFTNPFQPATIELGPITFGHIDPVPIAATLSAPTRYLTTGDTSQLKLMAVGADGSSHDATLRSAGTVYSVSNALMATVTDDGLIRIYPQFASGSSARVVAGAVTEGGVSSTFMYILGPRGRLTGQVQRADGTTVAGAQVSVLRLQPMEQGGTAVTNLSGAFSLDDVSAGNFLISAIDPATGDRALGSARIENEGQTADVTLRLNGQGTVNVTVVGPTDAPVADAQVTFTALGGNRDVRTQATSAQGVTSFTAVPAGDFTVSTRDPATRLIGAAVGKLAIGQTQAVTLTLQPVGQIEGVVYDVGGTVLREGVQVRILSRERGILTQSVTAADGAFRFDTLPISDGPFTLDAFVDGRLRARVPGIVISQPNQTVPRNIILGPVGTVTGYVKDPAGAVYANARVTMQSLVGLRLTFDARTDTTGKFVLPAVPVGDFELTAVTPEGRSGRARGVVQNDGDTVPLDVILADNTLVGTVYQRDGQTPVGAGITVYLAPRSRGVHYSYEPLYSPTPGSGILRTTTDENGRFGFRVPAPDTYYVQAEQALERGRSQVVIVNLDPSQPLESRVVFLAKGTVNGTVRDSAGAIQADVPVKVITRGAFDAERTVQTDAQGRYAIDGVFVGDISVVAVNPTTHLAGTNSGRLNNEGESIMLDVRLAASGTVRGRVIQRDGGAVSGATRVSLQANGVAFATREFDAGESYVFELVPMGNVVVAAEAIETGDKGVATTRLATAGETRNLDVRLVGQGELRVHLVDAQSAPVAGARVTVSTSSPFPTSTEVTSDANGNAVFPRVFAGDYSISASKPAPVGALSGSASGTLLPGDVKSVEITLQALPIGRVRGKVLRPDGVTPVGAGMVVRMLPEPFANAFVTVTDANGDYSFNSVEAGSYTVDAVNFYNPLACPAIDRVRGRATAVTVSATEPEAVANIQLIGQGRVFGQVTNAQGQPMAGIEVRMTNPDPVYGANVTCNRRTTYDRITDAQGNYRIDDAPPGNFTITAENATRTLRAEAADRVDSDGDVVEVNMVLVDSAVTMPQTYYDANGFPFDITGNGAIGNGHLGIFGAPAPDNAGMRLSIIGSNDAEVPFTNGNGTIGRVSQNGQMVEVDDATPSGLFVTRRIYTPRAGYFTRYIEVLRNDSDQPITVKVRVRSHHRSSNANPRVVDSSDGDQVLSVSNAAAPDRWVVVDDQQDADPFATGSIAATGHLFDGTGAAQRVSSAGYELIGPTGRLSYTWSDITVPAGGQVSLMHFAFNQLDRQAAREAAMRLSQLPPEAIDDLTTDERQAIANFAVPETSSVAPLPNLDAGKVSGRVLSGDGTTPVPGARVQFKSLHPLFTRHRFATTNPDGAFEYRSTLDGTINNYVIPVYAFELIATHPRSGAATALTPGDFDAGQVHEQQDLIFVSKGNVRGIVKRHNGSPLDGARVRLCRLDDRFTCTDQLPNPDNYAQSAEGGRYLMTGITPRDYFLFADFPHPQGSGGGRAILGRATATVTAGDTWTQDVFMEETGSISGIVRDSDGQVVVNARVELHMGANGNGGVQRATVTDTAGRYRLYDLPLGPHRVVARDAISHAEGWADASVSVDVDTPANITLRGFGAITVNVQYARGGAAAGAPVYVPGYGTARTDTNGVARFQVAQGTYEITAAHPEFSGSVLHGHGTVNVTQSGQPVEITLTLGPAGTVHGKIVRPDGSTLAGGFPFTVTQIRGTGGGSRSGNTTNTGNFRVGGLPVGGYVFTAYDAQQDRFADAEFSIESDGEEVELNLTLLDNRIALPATLHDANRFVFDVQKSGQLATGSGVFSNGGVTLSINDQAYTGDSSARLEATRRQFAITQPTLVAGLNVTRRIYVPRGAHFARYLEVFDNPSAAPITVDVSLATQFAGGGVLTTSSGDTAVTAADQWVIVDDTVDDDIAIDPDQMAPVTHVFASASGATAPPDSVNVVTNAGKPVLTQRWNALVVPAGGRVTLMHFVAQQINRRGIRAAAERLVALPPEVLTDLTGAEAATVRNFPVPADLSSPIEPLPSLTASVRGVAYEGDVRTPVLRASVTVQSDHPLFNRVWGMNGDPNPWCPRGTPVGTLVSVATVAGGTQNPPPLGSFVLQGQLTAADSIALPEGVDITLTAQRARPCYGYYAGHPFTRYPSRVVNVPVTATQNVIYDTGIITGRAVGDGNHSITSGRVYRSIDDPDAYEPVYVPIASDATFVYAGLPAGEYDFLFDTRAPNPTLNDGGLRGSRAAVRVTVGDIWTADIDVQPTGTLDGAVITSNAEPSRNARLTLRGAAEGQVYDQCATGCSPAALPKHKGKRVVEREVLTDSLGRYRFVAVPQGEYMLTAVDPVSGGRRTVPVTIGATPVTVPVTLLAVGSANVTVTRAGGAPMIDAYVYLTPGTDPEEVAGRTDVDGRVTVANIPEGSYRLRVRDPRYPNAAGMDRTVTGSIAAGGQQDAHTIRLMAAAKLAVTVVDGENGGVAVAGATVAIEDALGRRDIGVTNAQGRITADPVVEGSYTVRATIRQGNLTREAQASGTVAAPDDLQTRPVTLDLRRSLVALPVSFYDANRSYYDTDEDAGGAALPRLEISGVAFTGAATAVQSLGERQVTVHQETPLAGLDVTRMVYVPRNGYFARYVEILENRGTNPITVGVTLETSANGRRVVDTSSGDDQINAAGTPSDIWLSLSGAMGEEIHTQSLVPWASGARLAAPELGYHYDSSLGTNVAVARWPSVTVPAGQRVALLHFAANQLSANGARASAERLRQLPPEALEGLDVSLLDAVANFAVPADGQSTLPPLPALTGEISGRVLEGDGTTLVENASVEVHSRHPLFGYRYRSEAGLYTDATGVYRLAGVLRDDSQSIAIPVDAPVELRAYHPRSGVIAVAEATFDAGTTSATRDLVFAGGTIRGTVIGAFRYNPPYAGSVEAYVGSQRRSSALINPDGSYVIGGLDPGSYRLEVAFAIQYGSTFEAEVASVTVNAGQSTTQVVTLPANGAVSGRLTTGTGAALPNQWVELAGSGVTRAGFTDGQGNYLLSAVPAGTYTVSTTDPRSGSRVSAPVTVTASQTASRDLAMPGLGTVTITTRYARGAIAPNVSLWATSPTIDGRLYLGTTNGNGTLTVQLAVGPYQIHARHPESSAESVTDGAVQNDGELGSLTAILKASALLRVRVVDADAGNTPIADANVRYRPSGTAEWRGYVDTGTDGWGQFPAMPEGSYELRVETPQLLIGTGTVAIRPADDAQTVEQTIAISAENSVASELSFYTESHLYAVTASAGDHLGVRINSAPVGNSQARCNIQVDVYSPFGSIIARGYAYTGDPVNLIGDLANISATNSGAYVIAVTSRDFGCYDSGYRLRTTRNGAVSPPGAYPNAGSVHGRVLRPDSVTPQPGVKVRLRTQTSPVLHVQRISAADGSFAFDNVPSTSVRLTALEEPGVNGQVQLTGAVSPGTTWQQDLILPAYTTVNLRALRVDGAPFTQSVSYGVTNAQGHYLSSSTNEEGRATFTYVSNLPGVIMLRDPNDWQSTGEAVVQPADGQTLDIAIRIGPTVVEGHVYDAAQVPVPDAYVRIERPETGESLASAQITDAQGAFRFERLPGGANARLRVSDPVTDVMVNETVTLVTGQTTTRDLRFPARGAVHGKVRHDWGDGISGVEIVARYVNDSASGATTNRNAESAADGSYRIENLPSGVAITLIAQVHAQDGEHTATAEVTLAEGNLDRLADLVFDIAGGTVTSRVRVADEAETWNYCVHELVSDTGAYEVSRYLRCDHTARFHGLPAGPATLSVYDQGQGARPAGETRGGSANNLIGRRSVTVTSDHAEHIVFDISVVKGTVRHADGEAASYPSVTLTDSQGQTYDAQTSWQGSYRLEDVPPGPFELRAQDNDSGMTVTATGTLTDVQTPVVMDLTFAPTSGVRGTVTDAGGQPVPHATTIASHVDAGFERHAQTDSNGQYTLNRLPLGQVVVTATAPESQNVVSDVITLTTLGQTQTLNLQLGQPGAITGVVKNAQGDTVPNACVRLWSTAPSASYDYRYFFGYTDAQGRYTFPEVTPGPVALQAPCWEEPTGVIDTLSVPGGTTTQDVQAGNAALLPIYLQDTIAGYTIQVHGDASIFAMAETGGSHPFDDLTLRLEVDGRRFPSAPAARQLQGGRELQQVPASLSGLRVGRRTFVPTQFGLVRQLDSFTNEGASDVTVTVRLVGRYADPQGVLAVTPDTNGGRYAVQRAHDPAAADARGAAGYVMSSADGLAPTSRHFASGDPDVSWGWTVTVPAGQTVSFLSVVVVRGPQGAGDVQNVAEQVAAQSLPGLFDGLSTAEKASIRNFTVTH